MSISERIPPKDSHQNPFSIALTTELLEEPSRYKQVFSERILLSETRAVFQPNNTIVLGPQGTGKSMILNLLRYKVLNEFLQSDIQLPSYLTGINPFLGISINLTRAGFHAFGRRSIPIANGSPGSQHHLQAKGLKAAHKLRDLDCAADFIVQFLFKEFTNAVQFLYTDRGAQLRSWLRISLPESPQEVALTISNWDCWSNYYRNCTTLEEITQRCEHRLNAWRLYLAGNRHFPEDILDTLAPLQTPLHYMGNLLRSWDKENRVSLFVTIDQYEELIGLNFMYGSDLQRIINTLIKAREPVVFYKMGVRTYDWGKENRILGSNLDIEANRDYTKIDLSDVLIRTESREWPFAQFAEDVAVKRFRLEGKKEVKGENVKKMFGQSNAREEVSFYLKGKDKLPELITRARLSGQIQLKLRELIDNNIDPLELQLAIAWCLQRVKRDESDQDVIATFPTKPWNRRWWRKERTEFALVHLASFAYQRRYYYGWNTVLMLAGGNISAFLHIFSSVWESLEKRELNPLEMDYIRPLIQKDAIFTASRNWFLRDVNGENEDGLFRSRVLGRLGTAIRKSVIDDTAMSNPGHTGFSLRDSDLDRKSQRKLREFLYSGVKWAMLEVRDHHSKQRSDSPRHKWYLHPLLSPVFDIPFARVKEPLYVNDVSVVKEWVLSDKPIVFSATGHGRIRKHGALE